MVLKQQVSFAWILALALLVSAIAMTALALLWQRSGSFVDELDGVVSRAANQRFEFTRRARQDTLIAQRFAVLRPLLAAHDAQGRALMEFLERAARQARFTRFSYRPLGSQQVTAGRRSMPDLWVEAVRLEFTMTHEVDLFAFLESINTSKQFLLEIGELHMRRHRQQMGAEELAQNTLLAVCTLYRYGEREGG